MQRGTLGRCPNDNVTILPILYLLGIVNGCLRCLGITARISILIFVAAMPGFAHAADGEWVGDVVAENGDCLLGLDDPSMWIRNGKFQATIPQGEQVQTFSGSVSSNGQLDTWGSWSFANEFFEIQAQFKGHQSGSNVTAKLTASGGDNDSYCALTISFSPGSAAKKSLTAAEKRDSAVKDCRDAATGVRHVNGVPTRFVWSKYLKAAVRKSKARGYSAKACWELMRRAVTSKMAERTRKQAEEKRKAAALEVAAANSTQNISKAPGAPMGNVNIDGIPSRPTTETKSPPKAKREKARGEQGRQARPALAALERAPVREKVKQNGGYHALVIGNDDYAHLPKLDMAVSDAITISDLLRSKYGFDVTLLLNATRSQILSFIDWLKDELTADDGLLIYYAGHGRIDRGTDTGYWLPIDARADDKSNWIANDSITELLRAMKAHHVIVIADSSFSGTKTRAAETAPKSRAGRNKWIRRMAMKRARTAIVSGGLKPLAGKTASGHSQFANAFLSVLKDNKEVLVGQNLFQQLRGRLAVKAGQVPRYSTIRRAAHEGGDFLFVPRQSR